MDDRILRAALLKLHGKATLPASQFTRAQREVLDRFARQTGALICQQQGRGDLYRVIHPGLLDTHLADLSPQLNIATQTTVPQRARHIAHARDSKSGDHQHACYYLLLKAFGEGVRWSESKRSVDLPLSRFTQDFGAACLQIEPHDAWHTEQPLWLVENQALFDRTDWLPAGTVATPAYYGGQINTLVLNWLISQTRTGRVVHFPDYDGVGLANFTRLHTQLGEACEFWLMPDWSSKLERYGSTRLWQDTFRDFTRASTRLPAYLDPLVSQMHQSGRALEQEAIWLP
jgi:hypothetical protein